MRVKLRTKQPVKKQHEVEFKQEVSCHRRPDYHKAYEDIRSKE